MRGVIRKSLGVCAGLLLLAPASALAGEASVVDGIPRYSAYIGETNNVTVGELPGLTPGTKTIVYRDVVPVDVGANCISNGTFEARCAAPLATTLARAGLANRNDRIAPSTTIPPATFGFSVEGDTGDDELLGTPQRDLLDGRLGDDVLRGRGGNDRLDGDDNSAGDTLDCGEGIDFVLFNAGDIVFNNCEQQQQD